jgi:ABC-type antimicrobial peptide transport system permease subunit
MTAFGALGLLLAAVGVYGVIAYGVAQRTREIGVRVALGASRGTDRAAGHRRWDAAGPDRCGGRTGWSLGLERFVRSLLYGVKPSDPVILMGTLALLGAAALIASWLPARKAASVEPLIALRAD